LKINKKIRKYNFFLYLPLIINDLHLSTRQKEHALVI